MTAVSVTVEVCCRRRKHLSIRSGDALLQLRAYSASNLIRTKWKQNLDASAVVNSDIFDYIGQL